MNHSKEFTYATFQDLDLKTTFFASPNPVKNKTILYFHGGGLIYGTRNDLPEQYIQQFLDHGYHFLTFDYPLAPETKLTDILACGKQAVRWFSDNSDSLFETPAKNFILFGRSAGAYLAFLLAAAKDLPTPQKLISFYGYDSLMYPEFNKPSKHYKQFPSVPEVILQKMIGASPIAHGPLQTRYALYLYARQTGKWLSFLGADEKTTETFSLSKEDLEQLPPVFLAQSQADQDVPYSVGEKLAATIPDNYFYKVKNMEHDFDRDIHAPQSINAYEECLNWLG